MNNFVKGPGIGSEILLYQAEDGQTRLEVRLQDETVWLTQKMMAELFQKDVRTVNEHIQNIFSEKELNPDSVIRNFRITAADGKTYDTLHYNLDVIISVGYRVKSNRGTQFRQWATQRLREYIVKGFTMDDERLKEGRIISRDYFDELVERLRDIRASERMFYQKITDIYSSSMDYDPNHELTREFFATIQNKMHWAIHGHTAAEIIAERASSRKPHMGLTTWKRAPQGRIRKTDVAVAKNYLTEAELKQLNRIVTMYLDYAESQAESRKPMTMRDWIKKLDAFLQFNEKQILSNLGKVSAEVAKELAEAEFKKYQRKLRKLEARNPTSDFDQMLHKLNRLETKKPKKS